LSRPLAAVIRKVEAGTDAALQVTLDGLYPALPEHSAGDDKHLPGGGRRALLFADNRQVAASLAAKIEESHDLFLSRAILLDAVADAAKTGGSPRLDQLQRERDIAMARDDAEGEAEESRLSAEIRREMRATKGGAIPFPKLVTEVARHRNLRELSCWRAEAVDDLARLIVTRELARRPARVGNLEASGLLVVEYLLTMIPPSDPDVARAFQGDAWSSLIAVVLDMLRTSGLVTLPALGDYDSYVVKERYDKSLVRTGRSFEPGDDDAPIGGDRLTLVAAANVTSRRTEYLGRVLQLLAVPARVTPTLVLEQVWLTLVAAAKSDPSSLLAGDNDALTLPMTLLRFRDGTSGARWRCRRCATVWARQVATVCPTRHCNGTLESMNVGELDMRDRLTVLASQRASTPLLGMRTEEHTAQIGVDELADIETAFKQGDVNILVCSTTMELGIDIGGLSASVLTNVPPGASNYLQRAGRAGRRAEGTSLVLTFARPRPFDQAVFEEPEKPFRDRIVPPSVKLDSRRIVQRHSNAFLLSTFFRRYRAQADARDPMSSLRNVCEFFDRPLKDVVLALGTPPFAALGVDVAHETLADAFVYWLGGPLLADTSLAADLRSLLEGTALDTVEVETLAARAAEQMRSIMSNVRDQLAYLRGERRDEEAKPESERDSGKLCAIEYQENDLLDEKLLGYLAEEQFLPRYGFPVHVVPLRHAWEKERNVAGRFVREDDDGKLRLQRDVALALNEYAPGAEVVAAKHVYASRGILRHWTGADAPGVLASRFLAVCPGCGGLQYARTEGEVRNPCPTCKEEAPRTISVVFPKHGFAVKWGERPRRWTSGSRMPMRPVTEASYAARSGESVVQVSSALWLAYDEEGQIVVRTEGDLAEADLAVGAHGAPGMPREGYGYAICYLCGRAEPETDHAPTGADRGRADPLPRALVGHNRLRGYKKCEAAHHYWRHMALAGGVRTETLRFQLRGPAELPAGPMGRRLATTWMVALQLSGGETLGIDSRSIGGLLEPRPGAMGSVVYDAILYDQVAGGAGHCRALLDRWTELLDNVRTRLTCPNAKCTNGCHRCLIAFETQRYEDLLRRADLKMFLEDKWEPLRRRTERDGRSVAPLFRGGTQLREALARNATSRVIVSVGSIADGALADDGWLRVLLRHADGGGNVVLVVETVPTPDDDGERFIAERLRVAVTDGRFELRKASKGAAATFPWRVVVPDLPSAYFLDGESAAVGLGPEWANGGLFEAEPSAAAELCLRAEKVVSDAAVVTPVALTAKPPPPSVSVRYVPPNQQPARSTFDYWLRAASGESLFERPLEELTIIDPYIATEWQLRLLAELVRLAQKGGCKKVTVETYPPERQKEDSGPGVHRTVRATEQQEFVAKLLNDTAWRPVADPGKGLRKHKRLVKAVREDGSRFEVLLERGIDFITERRIGRITERTTRETFVVVRDPA
jgi:DEAD/DEAH box helicase domain-containing protein